MRPVLNAFSVTSLLLALRPISAHAATPPPEDGPWSGEITCRYEVQAANYQDQQVHTWRLTASAPTNPGVGGIRYYDATWSATGGGQRVIPATGATETWRLDAPTQDGRLGIWQPPNSGRLRFASQHAGIVTPGALQVAGPQPMAAAGYELGFQFVEGPASSSQITGNRERTYGAPVGWRQPPAVPTRETCAWNFVRSVTSPPAVTLPPTMMAGMPPATPPAAPPANPPAMPPATPPAAPPETPSAVPPAMPPTAPPETQPAAPPTTQPATPPATPPASPPVINPGNTIPSIPREAPSFTPEPPPPASPTAPPPPSTRPTRPSIPGGNSGNPAAPTQSASYLISVTQLACGQPTQDDPLSLDGRGDEIRAGAQVWRFNRANGQLLESFWRETLTYGDANRSDRIQAGSVTSEGGIRALDMIPSGSSVARVAAASDQVFPWRVWEGALATGQDALVIAPSLWEADGNRRALETYRLRIRNVPPASIIAMPDVQSRIADTTLQVLELGSTEAGGSFGAAGNAAMDTFTTVTLGSLGLPFLSQLISHREDRPIGLRADRLPTTAVVVTREIAEAVLQTTGFPQVLPTATPGLIFIVPKPGVLVIEFRDLAIGAAAAARRYGGMLSNPLARTDAQYFMVLQIERTSASPPASAGTSVTPPAGTAVVGGGPQVPATPATPTTMPPPSPPATLATNPRGAAMMPTGGACSLPAPGDGDVASYITPRRANLNWGAAAGATGYTITREDGGASAQLPADRPYYTQEARFEPGTTYRYEVRAIYPNGCGARSIALTPAAPTPVLDSVQWVAGGINAGVSISWSVPGLDLSGVMVSGPGLPNGGIAAWRPDDTRCRVNTDPRTCSDFGTDTILGLPYARHQWQLVAYWDTANGRITSAPTIASFAPP